MDILVCENVEKVYGSGESQTRALDGINLKVEKGEFTAIVGASGSGKSTLLHILGTVDRPTSGRVIVDGTDLSRLNAAEAAIFRRRKVGLVYQFYNLIPTLTVRKNILMPLALDKRKPNPEHFAKVVEALGISGKLEALPGQLSGGQQQRAAIARAMIKNPRLLLCDELTGALDTRSSKNVLQFVEKMNRQYGTTVVIITHNEAIAKMADQIIRIRDGRVEESVFNEKKIPAEALEL